MAQLQAQYDAALKEYANMLYGMPDVPPEDSELLIWVENIDLNFEEHLRTEFFFQRARFDVEVAVAWALPE